jgi:hypothetical protein
VAASGLQNDQVDPKEHEQAGEAKQDIAEREDQSAGETSGCRSPAKIVKITDVTMETTVTKPRAAQSYASGGALHLLLLGPSWPFLGLGRSLQPRVIGVRGGGRSGGQHQNFVAVGDVGVGDPVAPRDEVDRQAAPATSTRSAMTPTTP